MKKLSLISILILVCATFSSCSYYNSYKGKKHMDKYFKKIDKNNDGFISKKEYRKYSKTKFSEMDLNNDLKISKEEMRSFKKNKRRNRYKKK